MGIWSYAPFGNDAAADFAFELDDAPSSAEFARLLVEAIDALIAYDGESGSDPICVGYAAASVVLAAEHPQCRDDEDREYRPTRWLSEPRTWLTDPLRMQARAVGDALCRLAESKNLDLEEESIVAEYRRRFARLRECTQHD